MTRSSLVGLVTLCLAIASLTGCSSPQADRTPPPPASTAQAAQTPKAPAAPATPTTTPALPSETPATAPPKPGANQCQKDVGCGKAAVLPKCPADLNIQPYKAALNLRKPMNGQRAALKGPLTGGLSCTEMGCPPSNPCCNGCDGAMRLGDYNASITLVDTKNPKRFDIQGDETLSCNPYPTGADVVAVGTVGYDKHNEVALIDPTLCAP